MQTVLEALTLRSSDELSSLWVSTRGKSPLVKMTGKLIDALTTRVPRASQKYWALLQPYWHCSAPLIRNSLVSGLGEVLLALGDDSSSENPDEHTAITFRHHALDILMERMQDVHSFTR